MKHRISKKVWQVRTISGGKKGAGVEEAAPEMLSCAECEKEYKSQAGLTRHMNSKH